MKSSAMLAEPTRPGGAASAFSLPARSGRPSLLRAGHIVPWTAREATRLDPHNGLCLNALHDAAFDRGLMTLDEDMRVVYAKSLWKADHTPEAAAMLRQFEGVECRPASRHAARGEYLEWHRERVFARV